MDRDWSGLPDGLVDLVLERFDLQSDYLRCSVVCKSWYRAAKDIKNQAKMMLSCHHPPMQLIYTNKDDIWNLYNVMDNKVLDLQIELPHNYKRFGGSSKGWLVAADENLGIALINPFMRIKGRPEKENSIIHLPPLDAHLTDPGERYSCCHKYHNLVYKATITADPILHPEECIVVVIYPEQWTMAFIRLKDATWTYIGPDNKLCEEVAYVDQKFYAVDSWKQLLSFEISSQFHSGVELAVAGDVENGEKVYLVYSPDKDFLLVERLTDADGYKRVTKGFRVFAMDFSRSEWIEKSTLGDVALFLGDNSSIAVSVSKFPGCKPNCIYYNHDRDATHDSYKHHDFGVYNLITRKFSLPYNNRAKTLMKVTKRYPIWIMPTFQL